MRRTILGDILKNISPVTVPTVFYSSLTFVDKCILCYLHFESWNNIFNKKTFASSSSAWNAHRFLKIVWHGRVFRVDTFAFRYIQNEIVISNDWIFLSPLSNFARKLYLSGTSSGWILIQSDSRLYRSNKEEIIFYLFATNNFHHARKWSQKP